MSSKNRQIFVTKLPRDTTKEELQKLFEEFGKIRDVTMKRTYGFVVYAPPNPGIRFLQRGLGRH